VAKTQKRRGNNGNAIGSPPTNKKNSILTERESERRKKKAQGFVETGVFPYGGGCVVGGRPKE